MSQVVLLYILLWWVLLVGVGVLLWRRWRQRLLARSPRRWAPGPVHGALASPVGAGALSPLDPGFRTRNHQNHATTGSESGPRSGSEISGAAAERMRELFEAAKAVQGNAHVPYSRFPVGAAVRTTSGLVFAGCNVENAAYPEGMCAEASAIAAMVSAGEREIAEVLTVCDGDLLSTCCGGCRQKIREFARSDTPIHAAGPEGVRRSYTLAELLPDSFGPEHLT